MSNIIAQSRKLLIALVPMVALAATAARAEGPDGPDTGIEDRLHEIETTIDADRAATKELKGQELHLADELAELRTQMVQTANRARQHENAMIGLEQELVALAQDEAAKLRDLKQRRRELSGTLAALQRIALRPQSALLVTPADPNDIVRSGLLLRTTVPRIERRAQELRRQVEALAVVRTRIATRREDLNAAGEALARERFRLTSLTDQKSIVLQQTRVSREAAVARIEQLTREAQSLEELLANLEADRIERRRVDLENQRRARQRAEQLARATPAPRPGETSRQPPVLAPAPSVPLGAPAGTPSIAAARGTLSPPAAGAVVVTYDASTGFGGKSKGITYQTRPGSLVVAPWDGQIAFAGPFRSFGQILIIEHGEGYHSLLAGMGRIDAPVGQWVLAGEPVGITGGEVGATTEKTQNQSRLYVELRRDGQPINPLPWLAAATTR